MLLITKFHYKLYLVLKMFKNKFHLINVGFNKSYNLFICLVTHHNNNFKLELNME
jgi:hypothetical protein